MGNRKSDDKTQGTWSYNKNNELQSFDNTSFKYNNNGQMTEKTVDGQTTYYSYNLDGRLKEIKDNSNLVIAQYQYDPFGRRISKTLPQDGNKVIYFNYSNEGLIAEYTEVGELIQSYGYKPVSDFTTDPKFTYRPDFTEEKGYAFYINDHSGSPNKLILRNGRTVWEASADAFGKTALTKDEFRNPLRFPGQYKDAESTLRYNYMRFYDTELGRYITSDPIGLSGGINLYEYAFSSPVNYIDPLGLMAWEPYWLNKGTRVHQHVGQWAKGQGYQSNNTGINSPLECKLFGEGPKGGPCRADIWDPENGMIWELKSMKECERSPSCGVDQLEDYIKNAKKNAPDVPWKKGSGNDLTGPTGTKQIPGTMEYMGEDYIVRIHVSPWGTKGVICYTTEKVKDLRQKAGEAWDDIVDTIRSNQKTLNRNIFLPPSPFPDRRY